MTKSYEEAWDREKKLQELAEIERRKEEFRKSPGMSDRGILIAGGCALVVAIAALSTVALALYGALHLAGYVE